MEPDINNSFLKIFSPDLYAQIGMLVVFISILFGKDAIKRFLWSNNGNDRRKENYIPDYFSEIMVLHKSFLESNKEVAKEIHSVAKNLENLGESLEKVSARSFEEHEEIRRSNHDILREIKYLKKD